MAKRSGKFIANEETMSMDPYLALNAVCYASEVPAGTQRLVDFHSRDGETVKVLVKVDFDGSIDVSTPEWV
jgi:hypothetical protein